MGSKRVWKNVPIPSDLIEEIKPHLRGYSSIAEFVRSAIRYYLAERCLPSPEAALEIPLEEVA